MTLITILFLCLNSTDKIYLKDISEAMVVEMVRRISVDPDTEQKFCQSFGLDPNSLPHPEVLRNIREFFPDTPINLLKDTVEALQLYDLVDLLEKALKPRALRPALPLKEIEKLPSSRNRPTTRYSKVSVLIVDERDSDGRGKRIETFFKFLNSRNEVTTISAKPFVEINTILEEKMGIEQLMGLNDWSEARLARGRGQAPIVRRLRTESITERNFKLIERLEELERQREIWAQEGKRSIEKEDELQKQNEKFEMDLLTTLDKWKRSKGWLKLISYAIRDCLFRILRHFSTYTQIIQAYG